MADLIIIGGGLAGCEAAWQAACQGVHVVLYEMRPLVNTRVHKTNALAELVCSNSLGSNIPSTPAGLLKSELRVLNSLVLKCAEENALPAGRALAVDRAGFSAAVEAKLKNHPNIKIIRQEITRIPDTPAIIATGPLTSSALSAEIIRVLGQEFVFFYDAVAPIVTLESIDCSLAFRGSRYEQKEKPDGDYINCPLNEKEYQEFLDELLTAERIELEPLDMPVQNGVKTSGSRFFEACLPIEVLAGRNEKALTFGPLRPIGLHNPHDGSRPFAVLQLRQDNLANTLYNVVGFQTNLKYSEQERVLRKIPALAHAEFVRFGQMHRNTYISSPQTLLSTLQTKCRSDLFFAGQITGIEGYTGNIASGLLAGLNAAHLVTGKELITFPGNTMIGALHHYIANTDLQNFQPMKAIFGLLPPLAYNPQTKPEKGLAYARRSLKSLHRYLYDNPLEGEH
jgi:methylenetetrahydrofolate--tRNA-(uracil-5-)-methyltransferase